MKLFGGGGGGTGGGGEYTKREKALGGTLRWTSIPSRGSNVFCHFMSKKEETSADTGGIM